MDKNKFIDNQWVDIFPPPQPDDGISSLSLIIIIVLSTICLSLLFRFWQQRPRQQALRHMRRLKHELQTSTTDARTCLFRLHAILQQGLGVHRLESVTPSVAQRQAWYSFHEQLMLHQYGKQKPDQATLYGLIDSAQAWIRRLS